MSPSARPQGPEPRGRHRLFDRRARHRRRRALIALGDADVMVAGGAESAVCRIGIAGFAACKALSTGFNDRPTKARVPMTRTATASSWARARALSCSKNTSTPRRAARRSTPRSIGYGMSGDAYHITAPAEDGDGAFRCMSAALKRAGISASDIDYINAHGTSTPLGDEIELGAVERLSAMRRQGLSMSSTKSAIGHLLGAAGAVEAIFSHAGDARPDRAADAQPRQSLGRDDDRPRAAQGPAARDQRRAVQQLRLRRHQCVPPHVTIRRRRIARRPVEPDFATLTASLSRSIGL
jgi:hypothetical protein